MNRLRCAVGWMVTLGVCGAYSVLLGAILWAHVGHRSDPVRGLTLMVPATFVVLLALCFGCSVGCRKWDSKGYARAALLGILILGLFLLTRDEPPIVNDFSEKDVVCQDPKILASYPVYMTFHRGNVLKVAMDEKLVQALDPATPLADLLPMAATIEHTWQEIAPMRDVIHKLDAFPGVADLTLDTPFDRSVRVASFITWRTAAQVYSLHAMLLAAQNKPSEGARELVRLHRVILKALPHNGILVAKMINMNVANLDIQTARRLVGSAHATKEALNILRDGFPPLTAEDVSLRRAMIAEYLFNKNCLLEDLRNGMINVSVFDLGMDGVRKKPLNGFQRALSAAFCQLGVQPNRTLRINRHATDLTLREIEETPAGPSESDKFTNDMLSHRPIRNIGGWFYFSVSTSSVLGAIERCKITRARSDLLALEIHRKLGEKLELMDPFTGKPYPVNEKTGESFSSHAGVADDRR